MAAMQTSDSGVEMTDVGSLSPDGESNTTGANSPTPTDIDGRLHLLLEEEMSREPGLWSVVAARLQAKLRQDFVVEIMEGDATKGEPKEIGLLRLLDELLKLIADGLQVEMVIV